MRIARTTGPDGPVHLGSWSSDDARWFRIADPYEAFARGEEPAVLDETPVERPALLAPCQPLVVVGIAQNGSSHPSPVQAWLKSPRTVVAPGEPAVLRRDAGRTDAEGEVAVVIGRDTTGLTAANALDHVLGVTAVNDVSNSGRATHDPRNFEGKSGVGYTPLGPWIDTEADPETVPLSVDVDGERRATTSAAELPAGIRECLAYVASWTTLGPGDVVMTGAPRSVVEVRPGQTVVVTVAGARLETPLR